MKPTVFCLAGALCAASFVNCQVATSGTAANTLTCSLFGEVTPTINVLAYDIGTPLAGLVRPITAGGSSTPYTSASGLATFDIRFSQMPNSFAAGTTFEFCTLVNSWLEYRLAAATVPKIEFLDNTPSGQTDPGPIVRLSLQFVTVEMWSMNNSNPPFFNDIQSFGAPEGVPNEPPPSPSPTQSGGTPTVTNIPSAPAPLLQLTPPQSPAPPLPLINLPLP